MRFNLSFMQVYLLSYSVLPRTIVGSLEKLFRSFLWGSRPEGGDGVHLLAWEVVCQPLRDGRLGIQSMVIRQEALIA